MAKRAGSPVDEPQVPPDHNEPIALTDQDRADLLAVQLQKHREVDKEMDAQMEVLRGIRKRRQRLRNEIKFDGHPLKYVDEQLLDERKARHQQEDDAQRRTFVRTVGHTPITGSEQQDLFEVKTTNGTVSLDQDDSYWASQAYAIALRGGNVSAPDNDVPPERLQAWEQGLTSGYETFKIAQKNVADIEARRMPA